MTERKSSRVPLIDFLKAFASQLIIWHHLAFYGPMSDVVYPHAGGVLDWLYSQARIAVQAFLVAGGFLATQSLWSKFENGEVRIRGLFWKRYVRLARPYLIALVAAIAAGALARNLIQHPANPGPPSLRQVIAHVFLLQSITGDEALSAGVWYVAIDFQLYALLVLVLWATWRFAKWRGLSPSGMTVGVCAVLTGLSLAWWNRNPELDIWAPYFLGAYGMGVLAQRISVAQRKGWWTVLLAALVAAALAIQWRERILVAGVTAVVLACGTGFAPRWAKSGLVRGLGNISYSVFLIHYPVCLAVNSIVFSQWPTSAVANALGMAAAWLLSLAAGALLYRVAECTPRAGKPGVPAVQEESRELELVR